MKNSLIRIVLFSLFAGVIGCIPKTKGNTESLETDSTNVTYVEAVPVSYYTMNDRALLIVENSGAKSIRFDLQIAINKNVKKDEDCLSSLQGTALVVGSDKNVYTYTNQKGCSLTFLINEKGVILTQSGASCKPNERCAFPGNYKRQLTSVNKAASRALLEWPRMTLVAFGCMLEKELKIKDTTFYCTRKPYDSTLSPSDKMFYEEFQFPKDKVKSIHPSISNISVEFEHGDLRTVTIDFEKEMAVQDIRRIFNLPVSFGYQSSYQNVMSINYGDQYKPEMNAKLQFTKRIWIEGFEHMGAGDYED